VVSIAASHRAVVLTGFCRELGAGESLRLGSVMGASTPS
jgi:hypothetical protein